MVGAIPIFVDIEADTYNIDPIRVEQAITERTRAIIPVHFGGQPCRMDEINAIARKYNLKVLEDAAQAHGSSYAGRKCGSLADMGSFSFQLSKNMTAGEGGIITTNNMDWAEACESMVWAGRKRGQPWYSHFVLASNARMTEFQGALLLGQLRRLEEQNARRATNARILDDLLRGIDGVEPNRILPTTTGTSHHIYMFRYHPEAFCGASKHQFVKALQAEGIGGAFAGYVVPLYKNPMFTEKNFYGGAWPVDAWEHGRQLDYSQFVETCPVSERACATEAVWIPQTNLLADEQAMQDIARAIRKVQEHAVELV
jgi:dTDP-4-amino-4,6-dideoxygalactose transaminase